jgi:hypothetical protein
MPEISRFYGIRITLNWRDHNPPHFHAMYGSDEALIEFSPTIGVLRGSLPRTAMNLCLQWAELHREELLVAWNHAKMRRPVGRIAPLD